MAYILFLFYVTCIETFTAMCHAYKHLSEPLYAHADGSLIRHR